MMPDWVALVPGFTADVLGLLPGMLDTNDPASAREQLDRNYQHGGGWRPLPGCSLMANGYLSYPGDPLFRPLAMCMLRDEMIVCYEYSFVAIIQPSDWSFEVSRMD